MQQVFRGAGCWQIYLINILNVNVMLDNNFSNNLERDANITYNIDCRSCPFCYLGDTIAYINLLIYRTHISL